MSLSKEERIRYEEWERVFTSKPNAILYRLLVCCWENAIEPKDKEIKALKADLEMYKMVKTP